MVRTRHLAGGRAQSPTPADLLREKLKRKLLARKEAAAAASEAADVRAKAQEEEKDKAKKKRKEVEAKVDRARTRSLKAKLFEAETSATDKDKVVSEKTLKQLKAAVEEKRKSQRITSLIREKEKLKPASNSTEEEGNGEDGGEEEEERSTPASKFSIKVGRAAIPEDNYTLVTRTDPYSNNDEDSMFVGVQPHKSEVTPVQIRFDSNYIFTVGDITLTNAGKSGGGWGGASSYTGWSIIKAHDGENPQGKWTSKTGQQGKRFNMSGRLATMNELHRALRIILNSEVLTGGGNAKDSLKKNKGAYGIIDISMDNEKAYTTKRMLFSDYSIYIEPATYRQPGGHVNTYLALTVAKRKSEEAIRRSRANNSEYFIVRLPARSLRNFTKAVEMALIANSIKLLPITDIESMGVVGGETTATLTKEMLKSARRENMTIRQKHLKEGIMNTLLQQEKLLADVEMVNEDDLDNQEAMFSAMEDAQAQAEEEAREMEIGDEVGEVNEGGSESEAEVEEEVEEEEEATESDKEFIVDDDEVLSIPSSESSGFDPEAYPEDEEEWKAWSEAQEAAKKKKEEEEKKKKEEEEKKKEEEKKNKKKVTLVKRKGG